MNSNYTSVVVGLFLSFWIGQGISQPVFLDTTNSPISLCTSDAGVRLPANNQYYLGEGHHGATSCSVHLSQNIGVKIDCGSKITYEVSILLFAAGTEYQLRAETTIAVDSLGEAELSFDTELSPEIDFVQNGLPYNEGCQPYHKIQWRVKDECGGEALLEQQIQLYDCHKPEFTFSNSMFIFNPSLGGYIKINIDTIVKTWSDDCNGQDQILYSLYPDTLVTEILMYVCLAEDFGVLLQDTFYVAEKGMDLNCNGTIEWNERNIYQETFPVVFTDNGLFDCWEDPVIQGKVYTEHVTTISNVAVTLQSPSYVYHTYVTSDDGQFQFTVFQEDLTLIAERNDNHKNGLSTLDLVKIQKHLLGIEELGSPYQIIAADANNSEHISIIDLVEIRKLLLNVYAELPANTSWRFVPKNYIFPDPAYPFGFPETLDVDQSQSTTGYDFIGIKIGDVNGTVQGNLQGIAKRQSPEKIKWTTEDQQFQSGDEIRIPVYPYSVNNLLGFQFAFNSEHFQIESITSAYSDLSIDYFEQDGITMVTAYSAIPILVSIDNPLFTIEAHAITNGSISHSLSLLPEKMSPEVYDGGETILIPELHLIPNTSSDEMLLYPNPWTDHLNISFRSPYSGTADVRFYDFQGQLIHTLQHSIQSGNNHLTIKSDEVNTSSTLICEITTPTLKQNRLIVKI